MPFKVAMVSTHSASGGGVSFYTKNLIHSLRRHGVKVYLFSNKLSDRELARDRGVAYACWDFGLRYPFQLFKGLCRCKPDVVHVQHEFFLYGGVLSALMFPLLLLLAKLCGKVVVVTLHGVIPLSDVDKRFLAMNEIRGPIWLLKIGLLLLTKVIVHLSDAVVVHENFFAETLRKEYGCLEGKVYVIPHGVDEVEDKLSQDVAKERLGLRNRTVILFFGYIARYKGIETLIDGFQLLADKYPDWVLIIGGGEHPRLKTHTSYERYISELRDRAFSMRGQIRFTGFIPEEDLAIYFSAVDLLVFPYTVTMSSSGPFALATSYGKTVIASNIPPFKEVLPSQALFNKDDPQSLSERVEMILDHQFSKRDISVHVKKMRDANSWSQVGLQTRRLYQQILRRSE